MGVVLRGVKFRPSFRQLIEENEIFYVFVLLRKIRNNNIIKAELRDSFLQYTKNIYDIFGRIYTFDQA